jgi:hypothetical protein
VLTETAKDEERICEEKSVVNVVNGFVILVLILFYFIYFLFFCILIVMCFQPVICTK